MNKILELCLTGDKANIEIAKMLALSQRLAQKKLIDEWGYGLLGAKNFNFFLTNYFGATAKKYPFFPKLHDCCKTIHLNWCEICEVADLPLFIEDFRLMNYKKVKLPSDFSKLLNLQNLVLESCHLKKLPLLPPNIKNLSIHDNQIKDLENLPENLWVLDVSNNPITNFPYEKVQKLIHFLHSKEQVFDFTKFNPQTTIDETD